MKKTILKKLDNQELYINVLGIESHFINFEVYITSNEVDFNNELTNSELLFGGYVKSSGCSHINFGDENGYLHLCGKYYWEVLQTALDLTWKYCAENIKKFENEETSISNKKVV